MKLEFSPYYLRNGSNLSFEVKDNDGNVVFSDIADSDEILDDNNSDCIIISYKNGFNSIDDFFDFEEENYNKIYRTKYWDDFKKEFIKL